MKKTVVFGVVFCLLSGVLSAQKKSETIIQPEQKVVHTKNFDASKSRVKVALNAYSFSKDLNNYVLARAGESMTIFDLIDFCSVHNIPAVDLTGYFFVGYPEAPSDEYIYEIKKYAHKMGIDISGTGVRNNFANPDPKVRAKDVQHVKDWIDVASKLGASVIRVFAGAVPAGYEDKWDEVASWMIECYKECVAYGAKRGVIVGIQNHGDMLKTADETIKIIKAVNSPWIGVIVDTGYFMTEDPYVDMEKVMPYAVNFQVKESAFGKESDIFVDLPRLMRIINKSGYKGYLPIETLSVQGRPYDPYTLVPDFLQKVNKAIEEEYNR